LVEIFILLYIKLDLSSGIIIASKVYTCRTKRSSHHSDLLTSS